MTRTKPREDPEFAELVRRDVFGNTTPDEATSLRSPEHAERFLVYLTRVVTSVEQQLANAKNGIGPDRDEKWHKNAATIKWKYGERISEVRSIVTDQRGLRTSGDVVSLQQEVARLRFAIREHESATLMAGVDAEEWDEKLWSHVEKKR